MTRKDRQDLLKGLAFCSPWIIGLVAFTLLPLILSLYYSFCNYSLLKPPAWIGLQNYRDLMNDALFWKSLRNTFYYAIVALPMGMFISVAMALILNQNIRGQSIYRTAIFLPSLVPAVASAMLWLWLFNTKYGPINAVLSKIGIHGEITFGWLNALLHLPKEEAAQPLSLPPQWLQDARVAIPALIFMSFWSIGNSVVIYLAGLQDVPRELYEAAEIDGANGWQRLRNVTLPMISPVIFFNLIMAIIGSLQTFSTPFIMTGGGPNNATRFYTMYLYDNAYAYLYMGYASAMAWIQLIIILILTALAFWTSKRWVHYQGR